MPEREFQPRTAVREEKRRAFEAVGRSFCKTLAELITNSDSSAKRKLKLPHSSGLVDLMLKIPKGTQLDTAALRASLGGKRPQRTIIVEVVTARSSGRTAREVLIIDAAEGMSAENLQKALDDYGGDKIALSGGVVGRNLFGRGLSDVMQAHTEPTIETFDGNQLTIAHGVSEGRWTIKMDVFDGAQAKARLKTTSLGPTSTGTAVRFVMRAGPQGCHIPDHPQILWRLANFYMLRLIASDPNVDLILRQHRTAGVVQDRIQYDFPVGQVIETFSSEFNPATSGFDQPMNVDFLLMRSHSERGLRGPNPADRDGRENGLLIVDDLDAVYDLTFVDADYEKADFLSRIYGLVRVNNLRQAFDYYLNSPTPSSPLRPDRDGFNRDHPFSRALLDFLGKQLRPVYEKERKRIEEKEQGELSTETKKRIDDALKHLNKYFQRITELGGEGTGTDVTVPKAPTEPVSFFPQRTRLIADRPRQVLLLVREDAVRNRAEVLATATEGIAVQPETEQIDRSDCPRWPAQKQFFAVRFAVTSSVVDQKGNVTAIVEGRDANLLEANLQVDGVLPEPVIEIPETLEFRPSVATGQPSRRNNLVLYVNPAAVSAGHYVRVEIVDRTGDVLLMGHAGERTERVDIKLETTQHKVKGQDVYRVLIPWSGTGWNQRARVLGSVKVGGPKPLLATATIRLDQPEDGGFFKEVKYEEIDPKAPSQFAAGVITVNSKDPLNRHVFGDSKQEFDKRMSTRPEAQQRLASLLLEEASFRALQQRYDDNKLELRQGKEVTAVHEQIDTYKFESAAEVYKALTKART